ncbi:xylan glycosyltransferase MUCI21-like [Cryptomeria japonica]|uniref:xylan glycosyltransferase MUCI21-like n=1 Tax=Cryptomeria japonica TaxID=3369 RepID=UPI0027DA17C1|nr:xylan glycosyltransferase MUCI21-like [Cryptomeria japonica]
MTINQGLRPRQVLIPQSIMERRSLGQVRREETTRSPPMVSRSSHGDDSDDACQVQHRLPTIVFSTGGYMGNVYQEFNDNLLPLYITSQHLHGQVLLVILEYHSCGKPELMKDGKSIKDFRELVRKAYAPILSSMPQTQSITKEQSFPSRDSKLFSQLGKPKLVIISREKSRKMMKQKAIVKLAKKIGFEVEILTPKRNTQMVEMFRALNSCDVMVGVHGE